eukprot:8767098-Pyramimonas_sp.AAC.2
MATSLSAFTARLFSTRAARAFPFASPVCSSCTSGSTAPARTMLTWSSAFSARLLSTLAA